MRRWAVLVLVAVIFITSHVFASNMGEIMPILKSTKQGVDLALMEIDKDMKKAAQDLSRTDLKGDAARKILNDLRKYRMYVIDCSILNVDGIKITVEPAEYKQFEGADRSGLLPVLGLLKTKKPFMSDVYESAEGMPAISIGYPIFSDKGVFLGAVRMLIKPEVFLKPLVENRPYKMWVMQQNGLVVYDPDPEQIGKNIFSDDLFKPFEDLIAFSKTVSLSKSGAGSYSFYANGVKNKTLVQKVAAWDSAGLYGTEWRVVAMEIENGAETTPLVK